MIWSTKQPTYLFSLVVLLALSVCLSIFLLYFSPLIFNVSYRHNHSPFSFRHNQSHLQCMHISFVVNHVMYPLQTYSKTNTFFPFDVYLSLIATNIQEEREWKNELEKKPCRMYNPALMFLSKVSFQTQSSKLWINTNTTRTSIFPFHPPVHVYTLSFDKHMKLDINFSFFTSI